MANPLLFSPSLPPNEIAGERNCSSRIIDRSSTTRRDANDCVVNAGER